jgi:annexin A7/11
LIADLKKELGGNFEDVIIALMMPTVEYCAKQCHKAIKGLGTNEDLLVEILCSRPADEVKEIAAAYEESNSHPVNCLLLKIILKKRVCSKIGNRIWQLIGG